MATLEWNKINERPYAKGLDRGVLYLADKSAVVWNGLTSITEDTGASNTQPLYFDGQKFMDYQLNPDETVTLNAITYPDEFLAYEGYLDLEHSFMASVTAYDRFGLSFRVQHDEGYRIHLLYNLTAVASDRSHVSHSQTPSADEFSWTISGVPVEVFGFAPTEHFIFDSNRLAKPLLDDFEDMLYGTATTEAYLPDIEDLVDLAANTFPLTVVPKPNGIAELIDGGYDLDETETPGVYKALKKTRLKETDLSGVYYLDE